MKNKMRDILILAVFLLLVFGSAGILAGLGLRNNAYSGAGLATEEDDRGPAEDGRFYAKDGSSYETEFQRDSAEREQEYREKTVEDQKETLVQDDGLYAPDSIVLQNTTKAEAERIAKELGAKVRLTAKEDFAVLYLPEGTSIEDVYANDAYAADVMKMSPDYYISANDITPQTVADETPDEGEEATAPRLSVLKNRPTYSGSDTYFSNQKYLDYIDLQDTWNQTKGSGITVAVIDSGIDIDHLEFQGKISEYSYYASQDKVVKDYDMSIIDDEQGHGTGVAGVIAAAMDNNEGIAGIAPDVNLLVIKCDVDPSGEFVRGSDAVFGLAYAIEQDVDIINMSFRSYADMFSKYTKLAVDSDIICIASAGNDGSNMPVYPASLDSVIGVGAYDTENDTITDYSNYGENVDILAPGTAFTTSNDGTYASATGTSISSPIATAAAALYMAQNGKVTFDKMLQLFRASSIDVGILGEDYSHGYGELDIHALVCEEKGTITYDMLTDEIPGETQIFVRGRTVQYMPEPERNYVVYDGWFFDPNCTAECELYTNIFNDDVTLYASWINEDEGTVFSYVTKDDGTIDIRSYIGKRRYVTVPETIEGKNVTSIGEWAFGNNTRVRSVELPKTLTDVGDYAFMGCTALRGIDLPDAVTYIGTQAFSGCTRLAEVSIGSGSNLTIVRDHAFEYCGINSFFFPGKLTELGSYPFYGSTSLRTVTVASGNTAFCVKNSALYNKTGTKLMYYPAALAGEYTIDDDTTDIGDGAFAYARSTLVNLNEGLKIIGDYSFAYSRVGSVALPASLEQMGESVYYNANRLSRITFAENGALSQISDHAFQCTASLKEVFLPSYIKNIGMGAFGCSGLVKVSFAQNSTLNEIGMNSFSNTSLRKIIIPTSVEVINEGAFYYCWQLSEVSFDTNSKCESILHTAFAYTTNLKEIILPDSLALLGDQVFYNSGLTSITIGAGLTDLGRGTFASCQKLSEINVSSENPKYAAFNGVLYNKDQSILLLYPAGRSGEYTLPTTVTRVENYGFSGANKLTNVVLNEGLTEIGDNAFEFCETLQTPSLPSTLVEIGSYSFMNCIGMTDTMIIPKKTKHIGCYSFLYDYNLTDIDFEPESEMDRFGYGAFGYCGIEDFTIPRNISTMGQEIFTGCKKLLAVTFESESQLQYLPSWTFRGVDNLRRITFEDDSELTHIEARACESLTKLEMIDLSGCDKLKEIDNYAFRMCISLTGINLPGTVESIGRYAFYGCSIMSELRLPETIDHIGSYAFSKTNSINLYFAAAVLPTHLEENWDEGVGAYYVGVDHVQENEDWEYAITADGKVSIIRYKGSASEVVLNTIDGHEVVSIGGEAFLNNAVITSVMLPDTITGIYKAAFKGTANLKSIVIPANVRVIESEAFSGSGIEMISFAAGSKLISIGASAFENTKSLTSISIPSGVTQIREKTFSESGITTVVLPETVTEIGRLAFADSGLTSVAIPASVTDISYQAFKNTNNLKETTFASIEEKETLVATNASDGKLMIRDEAFYNSGLTTVSIPAYVNYIGNLVFSKCQALTEITVDGENTFYTSLDGVLYDKAMSKLITCPAGKAGSYTIAANVMTFAFGAFEGSKLSEITIPEESNLMTIGYRSFYGCENLSIINIPDSVQSIEHYAFANCINLETVFINRSSKLSGIYSGAFYNCTNLSSIIIPDGVLEISEYAFYGCEGLKNVSISETSRLQGIYDHAFEFSGIEEFVMPAEMVELGDYAFHGSGLKTVEFNDVLTCVGEYSLADTSLEDTKSLVVPDSVESIGRSFLKGVESIETLELPFLGEERELNLAWFKSYQTASLSYIFSNKVNQPWAGGEKLKTRELIIHSGSYIADAAFCYSSSLESIILPDTIMSIGFEVFEYCTSLKEIRIPENVAELKFATFRGCENLTSVILPDGIQKIENEAFRGCSLLETIIVPGKPEIEEGAFLDCQSLYSIDVADGGNYVWSNDALYSKDLKKLLFVSKQIEGEYRIQDGVVRIGKGAFSYCQKLSKVSMPASVEEIGDGAFRCCLLLECCELSDNLRIIEGGAFQMNDSLKSIKLPASLEYLGGDSFHQCNALEEVNIPAKLERLNGNSFSCCGKLSSVIFEGELKEIGWYEFSGAGLQSVVIPDTVEKIGNSAFSSCSYLEYVRMPHNLKSLGASCFDNCDSLERIDLDSNDYYEIRNGLLIDKSDGKIIFTLNNDGSKTIVVPEGTTEIGEYAFANNKNVERIVLPDSVNRIGNYAFYGCDNLKSIKLGSGIQSIGMNTLIGTQIMRNKDNFVNGVLYIDDYALQYDVSYAYDKKCVMIKEGTKLLSDGLFYVKSKIRYVHLPDSLKYIGRECFNQCYNLIKINIPNSVECIGDYAFVNCSGLKSIAISNPDTVVKGDCFSNCNSLEYVVFQGDMDETVGVFNGSGIDKVQTLECCFYDGCNYLPYTDNLILEYRNNSYYWVNNPDTKVFLKTDEMIEFTGEAPHNIYLRSEWNLATFYIDGVPIVITPYLKNEIINAPAKSVIDSYLEAGTTFIGWDINGDGSVDELPVTLTSDLNAVALYDSVGTSIAMDYEYEHYETDEAGIVLYDEDGYPKVDYGIYQLYEGESRRIMAYILPTATGSNEELVWSSSDDTVLSVDQNGVITALDSGIDNMKEVVVRVSFVSDPSVFDEVHVFVLPKVYGIRITNEDFHIDVGKSLAIDYICDVPDGYISEMTFESDDSTIATVDNNGVITGVAPGYVNINMKYGDSYYLQFSVWIEQPLEGIKLDEENGIINVGSSLKLTPSYIPSNTTDNKTVFWYSKNTGVAKVSSDGTIIGVSPGTTEIVGVINEFDVVFTVTVKAPLEEITLNTTKGTLRLDHTKQLDVIFIPSNTTDPRDVVWSSADPEIATVDETGLVTGIKNGKTVITGTVNAGTDNEKSATYTVSVIGLRDEATGITVTNSDDTEMPEGTGLTVEEVDDATAQQQYGDYKTDIKLLIKDKHGRIYIIYIYDISLYRDEITVQPDGYVDVEIPFPSGLLKDGGHVFRMEEDGTYTDMETTYRKGHFYFKTNHFSVYCLIVPTDEYEAAEVELDKTDVTLCVGKTDTVTATVLPEEAKDRNVTFVSGDETVATVDETGKITAVGAGETTITVKSAVDGVEATIAVTINEHVAVDDTAVEATCIKTGLTAGKHCSVCNEVLEAQTVIPAKGHAIVTDVAVDPTCTETGLTAGKHCSVCNEVLEAQEVIPAKGHKEVADAAVEATCTKTGLTAGKHCSVCNEVLEAQEVIPAKGHKEVVDAAVEATCTKTGLTAGKHCSVCNEVLVAQEVIPAKGHKEVEDAAVEATCTKTGLTAGKHCSVCNEVLVAQEVIPAKGHKEVEDAAVAATCTKTGLTAGKHCSVCNEVLVAQEVIPAKGHKEVEDARVEATCTKTGLTAGKHCSVCNEVLEAQTVIPAKGHTIVTDTAVEATCTGTGLTEGKHCSICNEVLVAQEETPAKGHTVVIDPAVAVTCLADGLTEGSHCSTCGAILKAQEKIETTGHSWDAGQITKEASCTEEGSITYTCDTCKATKTETIKLKDHTVVVDVAVEPTCIAPGWTEGSHCSVCNEVLVVQESVPAKGHDWDEGTVTLEPKCTAEGIRTFACSRCEETKTESIDAKGHTEVDDPAVKQTCTDTGLTAGSHCSECGEILVAQEVIPANGHKYGDWTPCADDETKNERICSVCQEKEVSEHRWDEGVETTSATCHSVGTRTFTCVDCNKTRTEEIPMISHTWDEGVVTTKPTCTKEGAKTFTCTVCEEKRVDTLEATGHKPVVDPAVPATMEATGKTAGSHCSVCKEVIVPQKTIPKLPYNGWKTVGGKSYFYVNNVKTVGWKAINKKQYYFDKNGVMQTGLKTINKKTYYFNAKGVMQTGLQTVNKKKYYFNAKGVMQTGLQTIKKKKYFFNANGVMHTGWKIINKKKHYFDKNGAMVTGWKLINKKKYYFDKNGAMVTGWKKISGKKYYFKKSGVMHTGWLKLGKNWYYLDKNGVMVTGTKTIGSVKFRFGVNGVCLNR